MSIDRNFLHLQIELRALTNKYKNLKTVINDQNFLITTICGIHDEYKEKSDRELTIAKEKIKSLQNKIEELQDNIEELQTEFSEELEKKTDEMKSLGNFVCITYICGIVINFAINTWLKI
jgi:predicted RNase H-like nuclease (RuvC/YqgF family)